MKIDHNAQNNGSNSGVRGILLVLCSILVWVEGAALFVSTRSIGPLLPIPGMKYLMLFAHFLPWLIALFFLARIRKADRSNAAERYSGHLTHTVLVVTLLLTYIALLNVELPLTMALRAEHAVR